MSEYRRFVFFEGVGEETFANAPVGAIVLRLEKSANFYKSISKGQFLSPINLCEVPDWIKAYCLIVGIKL